MLPEQDPIRVLLALDPQSRPIQGSLETESGRRRFSGWIELTAALEDARAERPGQGRAVHDGEPRSEPGEPRGAAS